MLTCPPTSLHPRRSQRILYAKSVRDVRSLELSFAFPDEAAYYATKPGSFLSHLVGHEGQGSILSYLKKQGWANGMSSGAGNGASGFEFFKITVDLTQEGLGKFYSRLRSRAESRELTADHCVDHHEDVSSVIFAYIDLLRTTPPSEWAFKEVAALSTLAFRYKEKSPPTTTAMHLSLTMSRPYPREKLLSAPYLSSEWNPRIINDLVSERLKPEQCRILLAAKDELEGRTYESREKWYGTEYTIVPMSEKLLQVSGPEGAQMLSLRRADFCFARAQPKTAADFPGLALPKPNEFVPTDLEIKNKVEVAEVRT